MRIKLIILLLLIIYGGSAFSQITVKATVDRTTVGMGDNFEVDFEVEGGEGTFNPPAFKDFDVLQSGKFSNGGMTVIYNGKLMSSGNSGTTYQYVLGPKSIGKYTIEPASVTENGKTYKSNSLAIEVVKGTNDISEDNLFLRVTVDKTNVYLGEAIISTIKIYTKVQTSGNLTKPPTYDGFWSQELDERKRPAEETEVINGVTYGVLALSKVILIPQRTGEIKLGPFEGEFNALIQSQGWRKVVKAKKYTAPVIITVKDLPDNPPWSFKGAVGRFTFDATLDKTETKSNEPVNLKVKISGNGNLKLIDPIPLDIPQDIETYDPKITDNSNVSTGGISGSKTFEYLLLPRHSGDYKIPQVEFTYFDLDRKQYVTLKSPEYNLKVTKGSGPETSVAVNGVNKEDVQLLGKDIRYIKIGNIDLHKTGDEFFGSAVFYSLFFSPMLAFVGFIFYYRKNKELQKNVTLLKSKKATKLARKRLSTAKVLLTKNNRELFFEEVSIAIWGYLGDKLSIPFSNLSKENISEVLSSRGVSEGLIKELLDILNKCEFARYAPSNQDGQMQGIYDSTISLITKLEGEIK